jgi:hypothetical protein
MDHRMQGGGEAHECERCGQGFPTEAELDEHIRNGHGDTQEMAVPDGTGGSRTEGAAGMVQTE